MSGLKIIRRRLTSVKNTKQITRAMKLVAAAKLKRAQDAATGGRGYLEHLQRIFGELLMSLPENFSHPLLQTRNTVKVRRVVLIAGERGLCGAYNSNIMKAAQAEILQKKPGVELQFVTIGRRATSTARRAGWNVVAEFEGLPEEASSWPIAEMVNPLISDFQAGACDEVVLYYTKFFSAVTQRVVAEQLLPFTPAEPAIEGTAATTQKKRVIKFSPRVEDIFSALVPQLIRTTVCSAGFESKASEHAARMTAMDSATRNADDLIERLRLTYNRARQSAITKELLDILGGAEAANG